MPRDLVPTATVDEFGVVHLARNHGWINPWNPAIATCIHIPDGLGFCMASSGQCPPQLGTVKADR
jgi:hypothetical protein